MINLASLIKNKNTSASGGIVLLCGIGEIWFPQYQDQFHKTMEFALAYGLLSAGDAGKGNGSKQTENSISNEKTNPPSIAP